jgi:O-methyltransferase
MWRMSTRLAPHDASAIVVRPSVTSVRGLLRRFGAPLGRKLLRYARLREASIRSWHSGNDLMADLAVRFLRANDIRGSYLEFGLYRGATFASFYHACRRYRFDVPMFGFDSFQGLPTAHGRDAAAGFRRYDEGYFSCSEDELRTELRGRRVPPGAYTVIPGFYERSLTPALYDRPGLRPAAVVMIDCFYYESTLAALQFVTPILQPGTLLLCNSYFRFKGHPRHGERGAVAEWCAQHRGVETTEYAKFGTAGLALILHPPDPTEASRSISPTR